MQIADSLSYYTSVIIILLLALSVLSILISENNRISKRKKRLFIATNALISLAAISECCGVHLSGNTAIPSWVLSAVKALDYIVTPMTGGALIALMQRRHEQKVHLLLLFVGNAALQILSAFHGWMIVVDEQHYYAHGPLYPVYSIFYLCIIVYLLITMVSYGKSFRKQNRMSLYAIFTLVLIGIAMQEWIGDYRVACLALALGAAFFFIHYNEFSQLELDDELSEQHVIIFRDALTGTYSRFAYNEAVKKPVPKTLAAFLIDINGLKAVNDSIGHKAGDELICGAARCIEAAFGSQGKVFRIGGDEFAVLALMTEEEVVNSLANLQQKTSSWTGEKVKSLSLSTGVALASDHEGCAMEELIKIADQGMYEQKKAYYQKIGRDRSGHTLGTGL